MFEPHLSIFENDNQYTVRAESGCETNTVKTLKFDSNDIASMELGFEGFDEYKSSMNGSNTQLISGKVLLQIEHHSKKISSLVLAEQTFTVYGAYAKGTHKKDQKMSFPEIDEISKIIKDTWNNEFSFSQDDLYQTEHGNSTNKSGMIDKLITLFCISIMVLAGLYGVTKFMKKDVGSKLQSENTLISEMIQDNPNQLQTTPEYDQANLQKQLDQETLDEFGLKEGIDLN